jgi:uncharacterized protein
MRDGKLRFILHPSALITVFALILSLAAIPATALDCPPAPRQWFNDSANLVDTSAASALNAKLSAFEQQSGAQFIMYVLPSIEDDAIERFTIECAQKWGVGQAKYRNGLVLFVFVKEKKVRIEVGYGLEGAITDAYSSRVIREYIAPHFQRSDWAGGLNAAADALMAKIRGGEPPVPPYQPRTSTTGDGNASTIGTFLPFLIILVFIFFILPMLTRRNRAGGCGGCLWPMLFMGGGRGTTYGGGGFGGGGWGGGGGGFSGGGGSFGGGGATGGW